LTIKGHIENGTIVVDDGTQLPEGAKVTITVEPGTADRDDYLKLRGTATRYDDPFGPAVPPEDWDALR